MVLMKVQRKTHCNESFFGVILLAFENNYEEFQIQVNWNPVYFYQILLFNHNIWGDWRRKNCCRRSCWWDSGGPYCCRCFILCLDNILICCQMVRMLGGRFHFIFVVPWGIAASTMVRVPEKYCICDSDGSGSIFWCSGCFCHLWIWKFSPKIPIFSIQVKKSHSVRLCCVVSRAGRPLIYSRSKVRSGWVRVHL